MAVRRHRVVSNKGHETAVLVALWVPEMDASKWSAVAPAHKDPALDGRIHLASRVTRGREGDVSRFGPAAVRSQPFAF